MFEARKYIRATVSTRGRMAASVFDTLAISPLYPSLSIVFVRIQKGSYYSQKASIYSCTYTDSTGERKAALQPSNRFASS